MIRRLFLAALFLTGALSACGEGFLLPVCGRYRTGSAGELQAALRAEKDSPAWEGVARLASARPRRDALGNPAELAENILARTLLAVRDRSTPALRDCARDFLELERTWPAEASQRRAFGPLCRTYLLLKSGLSAEERSRAGGWLLRLAGLRDRDPRAALYFAAGYRVLYGAAAERPDLVREGSAEIARALGALNGDGLFLALEPAVAADLLGIFCQAAECDNSLYAAQCGSECALQKMGLALMNLADTCQEIPGRGWEVSAPLPGAAAYILASRYGLAPLDQRLLQQRFPIEALFYGPSAFKANRRPTLSLLTAPRGLGLLQARSRVRQGPDARFLRLTTVNGGRWGDLLALYLNGGERRQMGVATENGPGTLAGSTYCLHTISSPTVTVNHRRQEAAAAELLAAEQRQGLTFLCASGEKAYPELSTYRRTLLFTDDYCLDLFDLAGEKPFTAEWTLPELGRLEPVLTGTTTPEMSFESRSISQSFLDGAAREPAYRLIEDLSSQLATAQWSCDFRNGHKVVMMGQGDTRVLLGRAGGSALKTGEITHYRTTDGPILIVRRQNVTRTRFAALHELYSASPKVASFIRLEVGEGLSVFEVVCGPYLDYLVVNTTGEERQFLVDKRRGLKVSAAPWAFLRLDREQQVTLQSCNADLFEVVEEEKGE